MEALASRHDDGRIGVLAWEVRWTRGRSGGIPFLDRLVRLRVSVSARPAGGPVHGPALADRCRALQHRPGLQEAQRRPLPRDGQGAPSRIRSQAGTMFECPGVDPACRTGIRRPGRDRHPEPYPAVQ